MTGHRVYISPRLRRPALRPGDYVLTALGWLAVLPDSQCGLLADHAVTEHDGGRITVDGPIHGAFALVRGVWSEAA